MSLIYCSECNNKVSSYAKFCPKCGCPIQEENTNIEDISNELTEGIEEKHKRIGVSDSEYAGI